LAHDWGYWGCGDIDGKEGKEHPLISAIIAERIMKFFCAPRDRQIEIHHLIVLHSQTIAVRVGERPSALCWPDKYSIVFDPPGWYLFRARLSGEIIEYRRNAVVAGHVHAWESDRSWYYWLAHKNCEKARHHVFGKH
jgi:hypothetical protein